MTITLVVLGLIIGVIVTDLILRMFDFKKEYVRKLGHLVFSAIIFGLSYLVSTDTIIFVCLGFLVLLVASRYYNFLPGIHKHRVDRTTLGEFYLPVSLILSAAWFLPSHALAFRFGVLIAGLADPAAGIIGLHYGRHQLSLPGKKTWQGTVAFFITSVIIFLLFIGVDFYLAVAIGLALALIEACLSFGLDNLVLPLAATLLINLFVH